MLSATPKNQDKENLCVYVIETYKSYKLFKLNWITLKST
jgi:hypothetical protein